MKTLSTFLVLSLLLLNTLMAQEEIQGKINGSVKDANGEAMEFVTIMLLSAQDSSLVKGMVSDAQGNFMIENIPAGSYLVNATFVGAAKVYSPVFSINARQQEVKLPALIMKEDIKLLDEITVETTKPLITQEIDKMVINVESSAVSAGNNALEVLEKAPGVTINRQNDDIQLKGKSGVIVYIDGKQTYLSGQDVANLLRNTPSENIESIEIITNPSSKYDAAGNTGIINIKMKKNKNFGTNGTATLGGGYGRFEKANASLMLNHRVDKINVFGNYSYHHNRRFNDLNLERAIPHEGSITYFDQRSYRPSRYNGQNYRVGLDYFITKKSTLGVLVTGFNNNWSQFDALNESVISDENRNVIIRPTTKVDIENQGANLTGNLNFKHDFNEEGHELSIDMDYSRFDSDSYNYLLTTYQDANFNPVQSAEEVRNKMPSLIDIWALKSDYSLPLPNNAKLEMGLKSSYVQADNNLLFETRLDSSWDVDASKSNHFIYQENINAAYANYAGKLSDKTNIQLGLRAEHTHSKGNSVTLNEVVDRNYINLFPTFFLSHNADSSNVLNFSYSRRIDRPNYQQLNPFVFYLDPYTYQMGNPFLQPQFTHSVLLTHVYKSTLSSSIGYSRTTDVIVNEVPGQIAEENVAYVTSRNMATQDNVNLTISFPVKVTKWWNIQNNITTYYNRLNSSYMGEMFNFEVFAYNLYMANNFALGNGFSAELSGWYNSATQYGFWQTQPQGAFSLGLQKTMLDKKLRIKANINDPLWLNQFRAKINYQDINLNIHNQWESRVVRLSLTYNFGNQNVKAARQRSTGTEAERNRAGGEN
jgi:hypothetical protein